MINLIAVIFSTWLMTIWLGGGFLIIYKKNDYVDVALVWILLTFPLAILYGNFVVSVLGVGD